MRKVDEKLRKKLRKPLGQIVKKISKPGGKLITIGDIASYELIRQGLTPDLVVYDNKVKRKPASTRVKKLLNALKRDTIRLTNPRGAIMEEAWIAIAIGLRKKSRIVVNGEEDLLVIPAVLLAKNGSAVVYGQPGRGMVLIKVTEKKKDIIQKLLDEMEVVL
jgi:hypothetical protein